MEKAEDVSWCHGWAGDRCSGATAIRQGDFGYSLVQSSRRVGLVTFCCRKECRFCRRCSYG
jgi:hypothetical protein